MKSIAVKDLRNGTKDLKSTNKLVNAVALSQLIFLLGVFSLPTLLFAQGLTLEERIEKASITLRELDEKARTCLDRLDKQDGANRSHCDDFMRALDGELVGDYIIHCDVLKTWRDDFVEGQATASADIEKNLQLMTGIEFACGEDALQKRTRYVAKTFELLQDTGSVRQPAASVNRRISELQIQQLQNAERLSLRNSILQQNRRLQLEADQRQDNLEKELLRQEINSAPFPGN